MTAPETVGLGHWRSAFGLCPNHWRDGASGALRMGLEHGLYCLGCCWFLMALMFAAGIMSLLWMGVIAVFVLLEKLLPAGTWLARAGGAALLGLGVYLLVAR